MSITNRSRTLHYLSADVKSSIAAQMIIIAKPAPNSVVMYFAMPTGAVKASNSP